MSELFLGMLIGAPFGGILVAALIYHGVRKLQRQWWKDIERERWKADGVEHEKMKLEQAIATAQQALAEVRPPRTEHKVNY